MTTYITHFVRVFVREGSKEVGGFEKVKFTEDNAREAQTILHPDAGLPRQDALELVNRWNRIAQQFGKTRFFAYHIE